ncbi:Cell cycle checkpoint protein RAD1 [Halotydeus destructor]|nr:Cell cycle checkpoint protein RAD1 [Halotydeus destructor]
MNSSQATDDQSVSDPIICPLNNAGDMTNSVNIFNAEIQDAKSVCEMLKALLIEGRSTVLVTIVLSDVGFRAIAEKHQVMQVSSFLRKDLFTSWNLMRESIEFRVDLKQLLYCLGVFTTPVSDGMFFRPSGLDESLFHPSAPVMGLKMVYRDEGWPLELTLEESGVVTKCHITCFNRVDTLSFQVWPEDVVCQIVMDSDLLAEIWSELDFSSETLKITFRNEPPLFVIGTKSEIGYITSTIGTESEKVKKFASTAEQRTSFKYDMPLLRTCLQAMNHSEKISLRIGNNGTICIHYLIPLPEGNKAFVEFYCCARFEPTE